MRRRVGRDEFVRAYELARTQRGSDGWFVCEAYDLKKVEVEGFLTFAGERVSYHLVPRYDLEDSIFALPGDELYRKWRLVYPFRELPTLFLDLARLYEQGHRTDFVADLGPVLAWVHKHGLLGVKNIRDYENPKAAEWDTEEDVEWLLAEASKAWVILCMYEAALNGDSQAAKAALDFGALPLYAKEYWAFLSDTHPSRKGPLGKALEIAIAWVEAEMSRRCKPLLKLGFDDPPDPSRIVGGWRFDNLLGAAYAQMFWLMASGGQLSRCEHCGLPISLDRPSPRGRKRRRDKRFCDDACRQANHRSKKT